MKSKALIVIAVLAVALCGFLAARALADVNPGDSVTLSGTFYGGSAQTGDLTYSTAVDNPCSGGRTWADAWLVTLNGAQIASGSSQLSGADAHCSYTLVSQPGVPPYTYSYTFDASASYTYTVPPDATPGATYDVALSIDGPVVDEKVVTVASPPTTTTAPSTTTTDPGSTTTVTPGTTTVTVTNPGQPAPAPAPAPAPTSTDPAATTATTTTDTTTTSAPFTPPVTTYVINLPSTISISIQNGVVTIIITTNQDRTTQMLCRRALTSRESVCVKGHGYWKVKIAVGHHRTIKRLFTVSVNGKIVAHKTVTIRVR